MLSLAKEQELAAFIASFYADPYGFVMSVYPWGMPELPDGSPNPLKDKEGPEDWQKEELIKLGEHIRANILRVEMGLDMEVWKSAYATGHGVGKTAFVAWLIHFFMSTRRDTRGVVTASTQFQLEDKTWPELAKWSNLLLNKHWFRWSATAFTFAAYPEEKQKNYRVAAATVSEHNTEAFAGLHNEGRTVLVVFDEASGVRGKVWEVAEGALTDGEAFFFATGNPTQPEGEFADCFDKHSHLYNTRQIDSRDVRHTNKAALQSTIDKYGIDSDEVKVRIRGMFPSQSYNGFIPADAVDDATSREAVALDRDAPLILAVDVAHFGPDESVIKMRRGWDARSYPTFVYKGLKITDLANKVAKVADEYRPDAIVIECVGPGVGLCDILIDRGYRVQRVYPGAKAKEEQHYYNLRAEMFALLRDWLYDGGVIEDDPELVRQLKSLQYSMSRTTGKILLESKEDIKKRGLPSPDRADTLALTFAVRIARRDRSLDYRRQGRTGRQARLDYNPLDY